MLKLVTLRRLRLHLLTLTLAATQSACSDHRVAGAAAAAQADAVRPAVGQ